MGLGKEYEDLKEKEYRDRLESEIRVESGLAINYQTGDKPPSDSKPDDNEDISKFDTRFYEKFFDVTTSQVGNRILSSLKPVGGDEKFMSLIEEKPDVYGLFWILITWVVVIAFSRVSWQYFVHFRRLVNISLG